jgi:hypothetical protein
MNNKTRKIHANMKKNQKKWRENHVPMTRKERKAKIEELCKKDEKNMKLLEKKQQDIFKLCLRQNIKKPRNCNFWRKYKI